MESRDSSRPAPCCTPNTAAGCWRTAAHRPACAFPLGGWWTWVVAAVKLGDPQVLTSEFSFRLFLIATSRQQPSANLITEPRPKESLPLVIFYQGWLEITQCFGGLSVKHRAHNSSNSWKSNSIFGRDCMLTMFLMELSVIESLNLKTNNVCRRNERLSRKILWESFKKKKEEAPERKSQTERWGATVTEQRARSLWRSSRRWRSWKRGFSKGIYFVAVIQRDDSVAHKAALLLWSPQRCFLFALLVKSFFWFVFFLWQLSRVQKAIFQNTLCLQIISLGGKKWIKPFMFTGVALVLLQIIYLFPSCKRNIHVAAIHWTYRRPCARSI